MKSDRIKILVDEEFGYRTWVWEPTFNTHSDFMDWFEGVDKSTQMDAFFNPSILPGLWWEIQDDEEVDMSRISGHAHIHHDGDTYVNIGERYARWGAVSEQVSTF